MVQEDFKTPLLLSALPLVVPVSLKGSVVIIVGVAHVSPPPRAESGDTAAEVRKSGEDGVAFRIAAETAGEKSCSRGEANRTSDSPSRARNFPSVFI